MTHDEIVATGLHECASDCPPAAAAPAALRTAAETAWDWWENGWGGVEGSTPEYTCMTVKEQAEGERVMDALRAAIDQSEPAGNGERLAAEPFTVTPMRQNEIHPGREGLLPKDERAAQPPPPPRHDPSDHDCRGGVKGDKYPLDAAEPPTVSAEGTSEEHSHAKALGAAYQAGERAAQPPPDHRWLQKGDSGYNGHRGTDSWECACGAWGSHLWMGWAYHLLDALQVEPPRGVTPALDSDRAMAALDAAMQFAGPSWEDFSDLDRFTLTFGEYNRLAGAVDE